MENKTIYMKSVQYNLSKNFIHRIVWQYLNAVLGFSCLINSFSVPVKQKNAYPQYLEIPQYHNTWNTSTNDILFDIKKCEKIWIQKACRKICNFFSVINVGKLR